MSALAWRDDGASSARYSALLVGAVFFSRAFRVGNLPHETLWGFLWAFGLAAIVAAGIAVGYALRKKLAAPLAVASAQEVTALFTALPDLYFRLGHDGTILDFRAGRLRDLYVSPAKFIGRKMTDVLPQGAADAIAKAFSELHATGKVAVAEYELPMPSGTMDFEARCVPFREDQIVMVVRNVTTEHHALKELRVFEARYRTLFELANDAILVADAETGLLLDANKKALALLGRTPEEVRTMHQADVHPAAERETYKAIFRDHVRMGSAVRGEFLVVHRDGHSIPVELNSRVMDLGDRKVVQGIFRDISERKHAEEALLSSETRFRRLNQQMVDGFVRVTLDGRIIECNDAYCGLTGYTREELASRTFMDLTPEKWHAMERRRIEEEILPSGASVLYEKEYLRKDGSLVPVELRAQVERDQDGTPLSMWAMIRNITERKSAEHELRKLNRQLLAIAEAAHAMGGHLNMAAAAKGICEAAIKALDATMSWIGLVVPESTEVVPISSAGADEGYTDMARVRWDLSPRAMGPVGRAIKTRTIQIMHVNDPEFAPWREEASKRGFQTVCALPLLNGDEVRGALTLYSGDRSAFDGEDTRKLMEIFARHASMVVVNAGLFDEARRLIEELSSLTPPLGL